MSDSRGMEMTKAPEMRSEGLQDGRTFLEEARERAEVAFLKCERRNVQRWNRGRRRARCRCSRHVRMRNSAVCLVFSFLSLRSLSSFTISHSSSVLLSPLYLGLHWTICIGSSPLLLLLMEAGVACLPTSLPSPSPFTGEPE